MSEDIPLELKVRRDAMLTHLWYLLEASKTDPTRQPEVDAATHLLDGISDQIDEIRRWRAAS